MSVRAHCHDVKFGGMGRVANDRHEADRSLVIGRNERRPSIGGAAVALVRLDDAEPVRYGRE